MRLPSLCLSSLLLSPCLLAQRFPEVEPNGTNATAQAIAVGTQLDASLAAGEQDWYSFTLAAATRIRIHTSNADTRVALLDAAGATYLAIDDDARTSTNGYSSEIALNVAAGSYTIQVVGFSTSSAGAYSLEVAEITPVVYHGAEVEPNDTYLTATPTTLASVGARYLGNLGPATLQLSGTADGPNTIVASLTSTVVSTSTLLTVAGPLVASQYVGGFAVSITSGPNVGLVRPISANTPTTITTTGFPTTNPAGTTFDVIESNTSIAVRTTTALPAGAWTPATAGFGAYQIRFTSGANNGAVRQIALNTSNLINLVSSVTIPATTDTFVVELVDVDYWQVVLTAPTHGVWFQINEGDAPWVYGHRYEVYDSTGAVLVPASSTTAPAFGLNSGNTGGLVARTSQTRVWPAGTYYIAVRPLPTPLVASATMPNGLVPTGNYMLELFDLPMDTGGVVGESEPVGTQINNTAATATPIAPGQIGQGDITNTTGTDSSDWWGPIVINTPSTITYQTRQGAGAALGDSTIVLRDAAGTALLTSSTGNLLAVSTSVGGLHARGTVTFYATPITVYLDVQSPGTTAAMAGSYELQISSLVPAPYVAASYATFAANATCGIAPIPTLTRQFASEVPALGSTFARQLTSCPPASIYLHLVGFSNTLALGSVPLPFDMTVFGAPGCTLNVDPVLTNAGITDAAGSADLITVLPGSVALRGYALWEQAIVNVPSANAFGAQISNYGRILTGERTY
jgi:hypothetical protein